MWLPKRETLLAFFVGIVLGAILLGGPSLQHAVPNLRLTFSREVAIIIGALIGALASLAIYIKRHRDQRKRLRLALLSEIGSMADDIDSYAKNVQVRTVSNELPIPAPFLLTTVYQKNTDRLGMLSSEEVDRITDFYSRAIILQRRLESARESTQMSAGTAQAIRSDTILLQREMVQCLVELDKHLDESIYNPDRYQPLQKPEQDADEIINAVVESEEIEPDNQDSD